MTLVVAVTDTDICGTELEQISFMFTIKLAISTHSDMQHLVSLTLFHSGVVLLVAAVSFRCLANGHDLNMI